MLRLGLGLGLLLASPAARAADGGAGGAPVCPDVCGALCKGQPMPQLPPGCPTPSCDCGGDEGCAASGRGGDAAVGGLLGLAGIALAAWLLKKA